MDENKIEEMAKDVSRSCDGTVGGRTCFSCRLGGISNRCIPFEYAKRFYKAGYRKESDTAREILECLRFLIEERNCVGGYDLEDETIDGTIFVEILNELKERYGVEVE